ncbi:type VI secretion system ImpA family N-terminal domain-containing protein [Burkholderia pyrrocinia]|uniref:type VI secretion system protein TssA n=1 Tax=Burkholderia TaxID=32008 RepID=UPI00158DAEC7|nr:type VI secretion system ImpA family N-terminal domain-containing protein [Burkholderia cenocepacia]EKS9889670.1 type VI secretion system ImpA family N-terminal domain-containing protein [Burkholderia pyrrocinia]EKS9898406.1 type VI secretion system ImpA family N-terminal domain-containing protein [Burkholderia pyrrocinia]EKS9911104.1 type VI secretion system ImpA family N-terminal domain-containing protein [Burkholderia pyrrocinia]
MTLHTFVVEPRDTDVLKPIDTGAPCGPDLEYDPDFVMLMAAVAPRVEVQYGDFIDVPQVVNWTEIERDCRALLLRTKDIRLAIVLLRCRIRLNGAAGLRDGLAVLGALFERYGNALHPVPMLDGERDATIYSNAIAALADPDGVLGDTRDTPLPAASGLHLHLRDIEKAFATPRHKDALAPEAAIRLLKEWWAARDAGILALVDARRIAMGIAAWCEATLGADAPDFDALLKLLKPLECLQADGGPAAAPGAIEMLGNAPPNGGPAQAAPLVDRRTALATIRETREWFEQNEPSSPVIVLLRQSERMVGKRFSELAHIIPADLLATWDAAEQ